MPAHTIASVIVETNPDRPGRIDHLRREHRMPAWFFPALRTTQRRQQVAGLGVQRIGPHRIVDDQDRHLLDDLDDDAVAAVERKIVRAIQTARHRPYHPPRGTNRPGSPW